MATAKKIVIVGGTGNIGHVLVLELLKRGHHVKALGRDQHKLTELKSKGAEIVAAQNGTTAEILTQAFAGADAIFSIIPPNYTSDDYGAFQDKFGEALKTAIQKNTIPYVLNLSSIGAQLPEGTGPIAGLHRHEQRLNTLNKTHILHLRPGFFMENLLQSIETIRLTGSIGTALRSDLPIGMIATRDIAWRAAEILDRLDFKGHTVFELEGPKALTMADAAKIIGTVIGKPDLKYVQYPYDEAEKGMTSFGIKPKTAALFIEMYRSFNEGRIHSTQKITAEHQGKTTFEEFAQIFLQTKEKAALK